MDVSEPEAGVPTAADAALAADAESEVESELNALDIVDDCCAVNTLLSISIITRSSHFEANNKIDLLTLNTTTTESGLGSSCRLRAKAHTGRTYAVQSCPCNSVSELRTSSNTL